MPRRIETQDFLDELARNDVRVKDMRGMLPMHPSRDFNTRNSSNIAGMTLHHSAVRGATEPDLVNITRYHVGPNHISSSGCPGLCYTGAVLENGLFVLAWGLDIVTWSQGEGNTDHLGVLVMGDFYSPTNTDGFDPTDAQWTTCLHLWRAFSNLYGPQHGLFGHFDFGKSACPGDVLRDLILDVREGITPRCPALLPDTKNINYQSETRQKALVSQGYDPGPADGIWGPLSKAALVKFQLDHGLAADGVWGPKTQAAMEVALHG